MRVIKEGSFRGVCIICNHCGAELEYAPNDVITHTEDWTGMFQKCYPRNYVKCPLCSNLVSIDDAREEPACTQD